MALLARGTSVHIDDLVVTLLVVVVAPFVVGLAIRSRVGVAVRARASTVAVVAVTVLVWLVASQARLSDEYVGVVVARGIAAAAFGAAAAAPLGLYGIMVMLWGTGMAGFLQHRPPPGERPLTA